jgi:tetratricopeptide (TPR) repeat protein
VKDERDTIASALAGRYSVERLLGEGGMGRVFLGTDLRHRRKVAIKVLRPELANETGRARFEREIGTVASLRHPHILPLIDSGEVDGLRYLITPYIEGETLRERLDREVQLPLEDAVSIARDVAEGLSSAHALGHVHRDVKPSNILLSQGHAIIADFGVARAIGEPTDTGLSTAGMLIGSPPYMSPEQAGGEEIVDGRSDIYALGCVVHEMLAGEPPFTARTVPALVAKHMLEPPPDLAMARPDLPPEIASAVRKALAKVPADRYADALAFVRDLAGEGVSTRAGARPGAARRIRAWRPWAAWTVVAGAALGLASMLARANADDPAPGPEGVAPRDLLVVGYGPATASDDERARIGVVEDELTRLLTGWDGVRTVSRSAKEGLRAELGIADGDPVSLATALDMARRAGVGTLVFADHTMRGDSTFLQAQPYDVGSRDARGAPISSSAPSSDVAALVAPVAAGVLGFAGAPGELATVKRESTSLEAIRRLYAGRGDLEQWRLESAERLLREAIAADSLFGRAHYLLSATLYWQGATNPSEFPARGGEIRRLASAARRLGQAADPRHRLSVKAFDDFQNGRYQEAREGYEALLASDSTDVYAWLFLGSVEYQDPWAIERRDGSLTPRGSYNRAVAAFLRSVRLSPDFSLGYGHLADVYRRVAGAAREAACYSYARPGTGTILPWESHRPGAVTRCPVLRDSLEFVEHEALRAIEPHARIAGAERFLDAVGVELRRWAEYAPENPWPRKRLADGVLARAELRVAAGSRVPWPELLSDALPHAERALELSRDTTPEDLVRVGTLRMALGDLDEARRAVDRALALAEAPGAGGLASLPSDAANALLATGRVRRALEVVGATRAAIRATYPDATGNPLDVLVLQVADRLQVYGATGFVGPDLRASFAEIDRTWVDAGYSGEQRTSLRRFLTPGLRPALVLDSAEMRRWFDGWEPGDAVVRALLLVERDPGAARSLLTASLASIDDGSARAGTAYLIGVLAQKLGAHDEATRAFAALDALPHRVGLFAAEWGLVTLSHLLRGRSYEALGDTAAALVHYRAFDEAWAEADAEVSHLSDEARGAMRRLRR